MNNSGNKNIFRIVSINASRVKVLLYIYIDKEYEIKSLSLSTSLSLSLIMNNENVFWRDSKSKKILGILSLRKLSSNA